MYPIIYPGYSQDMDSKEFKELKKNGYDTDKYKSDATSNDDGTLSGKLADEMYPYYVELVKTYGWNDYDSIYKITLQSLLKHARRFSATII